MAGLPEAFTALTWPMLSQKIATRVVQYLLLMSQALLFFCCQGWGDGWCLMCDVLLRLPLSLFVKIVNVTVKIDGIEDYLVSLGSGITSWSSS